MLNDINNIRINRCKVLCLTTDSVDYHRSGYSRRGFTSARMWAQYGGNHRGICFIFDKDCLESVIQRELGAKGRIYSGKVIYSNNSNEVIDASTFNLDTVNRDGTENVLSKHIDLHSITLFFTKNPDWRDEREYRFVLHGEDKNPEFIPIKDCIKGMVLGTDFPDV